MDKPVALQCPSCSSPLSQEHFHSEDGYIKCSYCGALMTLQTQGRGPAAFRERGALALPKGMSLQLTPHGVEIIRRWFTPAVFFLIPFCVVWDGFLVFWYAATIKGGAPLIFKLFPVIHVAIGVGLTCFTVALLVNRTRINGGRCDVTCTHAPLPWFGYKKLPGVLIDQLYAKEHISHGKNGPRTEYQLWLVNQNGQHEKICAQGMTREQALFIEQQLEKALGIKDRAVAGELPR